MYRWIPGGLPVARQGDELYHPIIVLDLQIDKKASQNPKHVFCWIAKTPVFFPTLTFWALSGALCKEPLIESSLQVIVFLLQLCRAQYWETGAPPPLPKTVLFQRL